jgi:hypothetical protein
VSVDIQISLLILAYNWFFLLRIWDWKCCSLVIWNAVYATWKYETRTLSDYWWTGVSVEHRHRHMLLHWILSFSQIIIGVNALVSVCVRCSCLSLCLIYIYMNWNELQNLCGFYLFAWFFECIVGVVSLDVILWYCGFWFLA